MFLLYCFIAMRSHHFQFQFIALSNCLHMRPIIQYHQFQPQRLSDGDEAHCSWISCAVSVISHFAVFFTTIIPQMEIFTVNTGQNAKMPPTHDSKHGDTKCSRLSGQKRGSCGQTVSTDKLIIIFKPVADSKGAVGWPPLVAQNFVSVNRLFAYKRHIVRCVHLR